MTEKENICEKVEKRKNSPASKTQESLYLHTELLVPRTINKRQDLYLKEECNTAVLLLFLNG